MISALFYSLAILVLISGPINGDDDDENIGNNGNIYWAEVEQNSEIPLFPPAPVGKEGDVTLYLCRMQVNGKWRPGKYYTGTKVAGRCSVAFNGDQKYSRTFEMLHSPRGTTSWVEFTGDLPAAAIEAGNHENGVVAYVCRGFFPEDNELIPGIFYTANNACYVGKRNKEFKVEKKENIEILVANNYALFI